jgi:hypothetical protein
MHIDMVLPPTEESGTGFVQPLLDLLGKLDNITRLSPDSVLAGVSGGHTPNVRIAIDPTLVYPHIELRWDAEPISAPFCKKGDPISAKSNLSFDLQHGERLHHKNIGHQITLTDLLQMTDGRLLGLDHAGINFDPDAIHGPDNAHLLDELVSSRMAVSHPGQPNWIFLIAPPSDTGQKHGRLAVKFEFVLDKGLEMPLVQFDVRTSFERDELERLFPEPIGFALPGLEEYFRSIPIAASWRGAGLRFDLRMANKPGEPTFSDWLLSSGIRLSLESA